MKKKILGIFVCMLLIATAVPAVTSVKDSTINVTVPSHPLKSMGGNWTQQAKILASDGAEWDFFGCSVSLSGETALIGAYYEMPPLTFQQQGAAYVFTRSGSTWTQQQKLTASDGAPGDEFGYSVSLSGDTALIGAPAKNNLTGAAYVFTRTGATWTQQAELNASDGAVQNYFGWSVTLSGDTALIGALGANSDKGAAYVFTRTSTTWTQQAELLASDGAAHDEFGWSVSLSGDTALIGAQYKNNSTGAAYVFTRTSTTWTQQAKLLASDSAPGDEFGYSVSLSGDTALIGAPWYDNMGSVYVFTRSGATWTQQAKLLASNGAVGDMFGNSVSLSGDTALIGAPWHDLKGSAYVFTRTGTTWTQQTELFASDGAQEDYFGIVTVSGDTALIGATVKNDDTGAAYVFINEQPPNPPVISGPATGKAGIAHQWNFTSTDPNDDDIFYYIDWGDGATTGWSLAYHSGETMAQSHLYNKGTFTIKSKAKDIYGMESNWSTLQVTMPLSYEPPHFRFFEWLLERFPNAFPILRYILGFNQ